MLLIVPFYMFSQKELAPAEDQGVVFGIIQAGANSTIDQTKLFADEIYKVFRSFPETDSHLPDRLPLGRLRGHGGSSRWSERKKSSAQLQVEASAELSKIAGVRVIPLTPPALPGSGGGLPVDFVIVSTAEPQQLAELANQIVQKAFASGTVHVRGHRPEIRSAADRGRLRPRQAALRRGST